MGSASVAIPGFTLLELVVTMVMVGVLAAVALPNYFHLVARSKAVEAKQGIHTRLLKAHASLNSGETNEAALLATQIGPEPSATLAASQEKKFVYSGTLSGRIYRVEARATDANDLAGSSLSGCIDLSNGRIRMQRSFDTPSVDCGGSREVAAAN